MEQQYLIDTNAVIDYLGEKLPSIGMNFMNGVVDAMPVVSVITKIEVLGFNTTRENATLLNAFINDAVIFELTIEVAEQTIAIRKSYKIKLPDAIIAATAIVNQMTLITRNTNDFALIVGLEIINPFLL